MSGAHRPPSHTALAVLPAVALDLETTGLDVANDRIVQVGAVAMRGPAVLGEPRIDVRVDPGVRSLPPPPGSMASPTPRSRARRGLPRCSGFWRRRSPVAWSSARTSVSTFRCCVTKRRGRGCPGAIPRRSMSPISRARRPRPGVAREPIRGHHRRETRCARRQPCRDPDLYRARPSAEGGGRTDPRRGGGVRRAPHGSGPPRSGGGLALDAGRDARCAVAAAARSRRQLHLPAPARRGDELTRAADTA